MTLEGVAPSKVERTKGKEELASVYRFLEKLGKDYPDFASQVAQRIPEWQLWIDTTVEVPGIADAILHGIDYVSLQEIASTITTWAAEVTTTLESNPNKKAIFILGDRGSGSQKFFAHKVHEQLPKHVQERVKMLGGNEMINTISNMPNNPDEFLNTDYWRFDDSTNSGRQIQSLVLPDFTALARNIKQKATDDEFDLMYPYNEFLQGKQDAAPNLNLRFIRITAQAEEYINNSWKRLSSNENIVPIQLNIGKEGTFPTIADVLADKIDTNPAFLYAQDHVIGLPIVGFFATKIQDNLPHALAGGKHLPPGSKALFEDSDIVSPWKAEKA